MIMMMMTLPEKKFRNLVQNGFLECVETQKLLFERLGEAKWCQELHCLRRIRV